MKRIVLLNGCSERMETLPLSAAKAFIKGLNENNSYEVVTINLYDKDIEYCTGCKECLNNENKCCICDDLKYILNKLNDASYIIWVAPIYSLSFPYKIKALLERILAFNIKQKEEIGVKAQCQHILFSTLGLYSYENKYEHLMEYTDLFFGKASLRLLCPSEEDEYTFGYKGINTESIKNFEEAGREYRVNGDITIEDKEKLYGSFMPKDVLHNLFDSMIEEGKKNNPYYYITDITAKRDLNKGTNVLLLFLPWIAMGLFIPFSSELSGTVALAFCALIPIFSFKYKLTTYDSISHFLAIVMGLFLLISNKEEYMASIVYFIFGALCISSLFTKTPISAYYFYKYYWDSKSFTIDAFIKINRIISTSWGVLFLLISLINNFIIGTSLFNYEGIVVIIAFEVLYLLALYVPKIIYKHK